MVFSLLQAALDWCFANAVSRVDIQLDINNWPANARLALSFRHKPADEVEDTPAPAVASEEPQLNTMSWRLVQQIAAVLGLQLERFDTPSRAHARLHFHDTLTPRLPGLSVAESDDSGVLSPNSQPLVGRHVVVLAARREIRNTVRQALRPMGLMVDFVSSIEEAQLLCSDGLPHALVYDSTLAGDRFEALRTEMLSEAPNIVFIRLAEQGKALKC